MYIEGCSEDLMYLFCLSILDVSYLIYWSCDRFDIHCTYIWFIYTNVCSFTYLYMCYFFSFYIHMILISCMQSIISVSHKDALISFL